MLLLSCSYFQSYKLEDQGRSLILLLYLFITTISFKSLERCYQARASMH
jgi:hypothetical protein